MKSSNQLIEQVHSYNVNIKDREIYFHGHSENDSDEIDFKLAATFTKNLRILQNENDKPITIHLNSPGGCSVSGFGLYDAIRACPNHITCVVYGEASSMASIILQAADVRKVHKHTVMVLHYGYVHINGTCQSVASFVDYDKKMIEIMVDIYVDRCFDAPYFTGQSKSKIKKELTETLQKKQDVYLIGEEIVNYGLADEVIS